MSKIGIVGCGWLGLPLAILLIKKGHSVIGSTTSESKLAILNELGIQGENLDSFSFIFNRFNPIFESDW